MRQSNHNFPPQNRAAVVISNALYDRRAFDSPISTLPLLSSLTHLSYLTSTSPRIREILTIDGGLERLVYIASACIELARNPSAPPRTLKCTCNATRADGMAVDPSPSHAPLRTCACLLRRPSGPRFRAFSAYSKRSHGALPSTEARTLLMTYTLALQSLVNVGVRGSEHIRTRVVQAGVLALAVRVLRGFLAERVRHAAESSAGMANILTVITAPSGLDATDSDSELSPVPPVTRTPTPDAVALVADEPSSVQEEQEQDAQDAQEDAEMESSVAMAARARSATIKSGPSPPTEVIHTIGEMDNEDDDAMDIDDDASPPESAGESDGDAELDGLDTDPSPMPSSAPSPVPDRTAFEVTPRASIMRLPNAAFEGSPLSPHVHLVSPTISSTSTAMAATSALAFRFREDDVLLCLQLLAYLSKYPHVRAVFHEPDRAYDCAVFPRNADGSPAPQPASAPPADPSKNVFSLVEKFTVRPSPNDRSVPKLPSEIQYWAGVIMRNACRKDESRGGIRQCANMLCGVWEKYPREFAKCRRCRKAKYCSKSCQSKAWQGGHRYWCSARDPSDHSGHHGRDASAATAATDGTGATTTTAATTPTTAHGAVVPSVIDLLDEDDDDLPARPPQPRTHILLRHQALPEAFANPTATVGPGIGVQGDDDVQLVGVHGSPDVEDLVDEGVARFF